VLGPDVAHRRTEYSVDELLERVRTIGFPDPEKFYGESLLQPSPRKEVAEYFESVAGRAR
jgi:hypothetical protein